jgi:hypothetical protein
LIFPHGHKDDEEFRHRILFLIKQGSRTYHSKKELELISTTCLCKGLAGWAVAVTDCFGKDISDVSHTDIIYLRKILVTEAHNNMNIIMEKFDMNDKEF